MGKIGDLWVRLGLKNDEFTKGIDKSKKKTEELQKPIGGVKEAFNGLKAGALAVWAAIGSAVVGFGKEMINTTNAIGDAWGRMTAGLTAGWKTFVQAVSNFDFNGFIGKFREATAAAVELQNALDAEFESSNSIKIQKALMSDELEELRISMRDQTKSYKERLAAAEEYMRKVTPIYQQEVRLANELLDAWQGKWLAGTSLTDNAGTREDLMKFLVDYGKDRQLASKVARYLELEGERELGWGSILTNSGRANQKAVDIARGKSQEHQGLRNWLKQYGADNGYNNFIGELANVYENWRGDDDTKPLVDAIVAAGNAQAGLNRETRQIQNIQNSILAAIEKEGEPVRELLAQARADMEATLAEDMALLDKANELRMSMEANPLPKMSAEAQQMINELAAPDFFSDDWLQGQKENLDELKNKLGELGLAAQQASSDTAAQVSSDAMEITLDFSDAIISSLGGGFQALTDMMMGLDGADTKQVMAAFIQPFADTMKNMGALIMSAGLATAKLKLSFANPAGAIAAGAALMALGAMVSSGVQSMLANPTGGGSGSTASYGGNSTPALHNYESTLTVEVVGRLSGNDILLSGKRTQEKLRR
jgi:hypothetical protein